MQSQLNSSLVAGLDNHNGIKAKIVRQAGTAAKPAGFFGRQVAWAHALAPGSIAFTSTTIHIGDGEFTMDDFNEEVRGII